MNTVWMIRNDGNVFPCVHHICANLENVEETLFAAQWLYANTRHEESRQLALETVAAWMASVSVNGSKTSNFPGTISRTSYSFLSQEFVTKHAAEIKAIPIVNLHLTALCGEVAAELNQEFLRAFYGDMIHTNASPKEMFFCISSIGFDWYKIIRSFLSTADFPVERIAILRDEASTGAEKKFYLQLPFETFLSGQQIMLTNTRKFKGGVMMREIYAHLSYGSALRHIAWDLEIEAGKLANRLHTFSCLEKRRLMALSANPVGDGIFLWDEVGDFHEGLACVLSGDYWGYMDESGRVVIEPQFRHASGFYGGFACVSIDNKYSYINKAGKLIAAAIYDNAHLPYRNDERGCYEAKVNLNGKWLIISLGE